MSQLDKNAQSDAKGLQALHDFIEGMKTQVFVDKYSVPMSDVIKAEEWLMIVQKQENFSSKTPLAQKVLSDFDTLKEDVIAAEIKRPKHLKHLEEKNKKKEDKQTSTINKMDKMLESYINLLEAFLTNSKKQTPAAIASLLTSMKETNNILKAPASTTEDKVNSLYKVEGNITQTLLVKDIQQLKNSSTGLFVSQDKAFLGGFTRKLDNERPQRRELLDTLEQPKFKFVK